MSNTFQDVDLCERAKEQIRNMGFSATVLPPKPGSKRSAHLIEIIDVEDYAEEADDGQKRLKPATASVKIELTREGMVSKTMCSGNGASGSTSCNGSTITARISTTEKGSSSSDVVNGETK